MNLEGLLISERIDEVARMCDRENPIYEQISSFSIALYVLGLLKGSDLLAVDDIDAAEAGAVLKEHFDRINVNEIPADYGVAESREKYLLVLGDPSFPTHFAVITDMKAPRSFFSKLFFFGCGFDSLSDLKSEFLGKEGLACDEISYFRLKGTKPIQKKSPTKIYTLNSNGEYSVLEYELAN